MEYLIPRYVEALHAELERVAAAGPRGVAPPWTEAPLEWPKFASVFVGGGTPTLLEPEVLAGVLERVRAVLPLTDDAEVTVEANPETVTGRGMLVLAHAGVNRVSLGAQSFALDVLATLGRWHTPGKPLEAVKHVRNAGITRINLDLIYGTPGERPSAWQNTLEAVLGAYVNHVSAYALTVEPNTVFAGRVRRREVPAPDEDVQAEREEVARSMLGEAGYRRYEVSNWARISDVCRHNLNYWRGGDWLGIGAGAHGHWRAPEGIGTARRWWGLRAPARWADAALAGEPTYGGQEVLDRPAIRMERLLMGLRTAEGVAREDVEPLPEARVAALVESGVLADERGRLRVPEPKLGLADGVVRRLLPAA
jgi:putative oxygen-independent coproporphyrinogen III oxidase